MLSAPSSGMPRDGEAARQHQGSRKVEEAQEVWVSGLEVHMECRKQSELASLPLTFPSISALS